MFKTGDVVVFTRPEHKPEVAVVIEDQFDEESMIEVFRGSMADYEALEAAYAFAGWPTSVVNIQNDERCWLAYPSELEVGIPNYGDGSCGIWGCSTCV